MVQFRISTVVGMWGKKLGKEEISIILSEWEFQSLLKGCHHWNKKLYNRIKNELILEAKKEGYEIGFEFPDMKKKEVVR
jgi:hypothetical protein